MSRWAEAGVTLPEVLAALLLIGVAIVPLLHLYPSALDASRASEVHTVLSGAAVRKMEEVISIIRAPNARSARLDNSAGAAVGAVSSSSAPLTLGAAANYVLILVGTGNATAVSAVAVGAATATRLAALSHPSSSLRGELWGVPAPPTGTQTVTVTLAGAASHSWVAASFANVLSGAPVGAMATDWGSSARPRVSVGSRAANTLLVGGFTFRALASATVTEGAGQTAIRAAMVTTALTHLSGETAPGSAGTGMNWRVVSLSNDWVALAAELRGIPGGAAGSTSGNAACADVPDCRLQWTTATEQSSGTAGVGRLEQVSVVACRDTNRNRRCDAGEPQVRYATKATTRP